MSEYTTIMRRRARRRDAGMTLPELLVSVSMMGLIVTVLCSAIVVTLRQQSSSEGRLNIARSEQNVGLWMPSDLSSADEVNKEPSASPCEASMCPEGIDLSKGSNVVMMTWEVDTDIHGNGFRTNVSYHFTPSGDGETYELWRVECISPYSTNTNGDHVIGGSWTCSKLVALRELAGPPVDEFGNPMAFVPGETSPTWVIRVSEPLAPDQIAGPEAETELTDPLLWKDANRVIVTIDGGGATAGAGGGRNQISITAGGTNRDQIATTSMVGSPSFVAARSRCGGPITLVIDESQSIGATNIEIVRAAVREFIDAVRGTPVKIQIVTFTEYSRVLGIKPTDPPEQQWHKYYDMTNPAQADELYNLASDIKLGGAGGSGYTSWEEALYRVGYEKNGTITTKDMPHTVVFFTDGIPTQDRSSKPTAGASNPVGWPTVGQSEYVDLNKTSAWGTYNYGTEYHQVAFNRAEWIARQLRGKTKLIAVGVGVFDPTAKDDKGKAVDVDSAWRATPSSSAVNKLNKDILADLIVGDVIDGANTAPLAETGTNSAGETYYKNPDTARLYLPKTWSLLPTALRTVALGECAGTITFQTRLATPDADGQYPYVTDAFRYIARKVTDSNGVESTEVQKFAETNMANTARTFDLSIQSGQYVDVEFLPLNFTTRAAEGYSTDRWECTVAGVPVTNLPSLDSGEPNWSGFALRITANGAASCTHYVKYNPPP